MFDNIRVNRIFFIIVTVSKLSICIFLFSQNINLVNLKFFKIYGFCEF